MTQNTKLIKVGDRKIYYCEIWLFKEKKMFTCAMDVKTQAEARKELRRSILNRFGNVKYKVMQIFDLPPEFEIEEVKK